MVGGGGERHRGGAVQDDIGDGGAGRSMDQGYGVRQDRAKDGGGGGTAADGLVGSAGGGGGSRDTTEFPSSWTAQFR